MCRLSPPRPDEPAGRNSLPELVARLVSEESLDRSARSRLLGRLALALAGRARGAGGGAITGGRWLVDVVLELAPHLAVRDLTTLRAHHGGRSGDELAEALVAAAAKTTAAIGAAGGALAALEFAAPPTLLTAPVQLAAETVAVVAVELKLVAELHEVYRAAVPAPPAERAAAYAVAWARQRGVDPFGSGGLGSVLGTAARRELRQRLVRRTGRNVVTLAPFLAGALAGAEMNRRQTRSLGAAVTRDLRRRATGGWFRP